MLGVPGSEQEIAVDSRMEDPLPPLPLGPPPDSDRNQGPEVPTAAARPVAAAAAQPAAAAAVRNYHTTDERSDKHELCLNNFSGGVIFRYSATPGVIFGQKGTLCDNF